jgi:hypothetical protein
MGIELTRPIEIFYCYARRDKELREYLAGHLEPLKRSGQIIAWYDREILPGVEWKREIDKHLNSSDIILLLISPNFMRSDYCYSVEMQRALERHAIGEACVIPIILRPVGWKETPVGKLQVLPTDGKPITMWRDRDVALQDVVAGIRTVIETLSSVKQERIPKAWKQGESMKGWFLAGSHPQNYEQGIVTHNGKKSGYLKAQVVQSGGFGTLMQMFKADSYRNKRMRLSAAVKSEGVENWAGLWMRIDGPEETLGFDNMQNRPIKGTTSWQKYEV